LSLPEDEPEILARVLIYLYTGIYESDNIAEGLAGSIAQFTRINDQYPAASEDPFKDTELTMKVFNLANRMLMSEFQDSLRCVAV